jgi:hypothetical protein
MVKYQHELDVHESGKYDIGMSYSYRFENDRFGKLRHHYNIFKNGNYCFRTSFKEDHDNNICASSSGSSCWIMTLQKGDKIEIKIKEDDNNFCVAVGKFNFITKLNT